MDNQTDDNSTSFKEQFDPSLVSEIIISVDAGDKKSLLSIIKKLPSSDIADIINLLKSSERESFVDLIKEEFKPEILSDLEDSVREEIIHYLGYNFIADIIPRLRTDDAVHVIEDLEENEKEFNSPKNTFKR